jgi:hypothetical protein
LAYNNINEEGGRALYTSLLTNKKLKKIWVMNNLFNSKIVEAIHKKVGERSEEPFDINSPEEEDKEEPVVQDLSLDVVQIIINFGCHLIIIIGSS